MLALSNSGPPWLSDFSSCFLFYLSRAYSGGAWHNTPHGTWPAGRSPPSSTTITCNQRNPVVLRSRPLSIAPSPSFFPTHAKRRNPQPRFLLLRGRKEKSILGLRGFFFRHLPSHCCEYVPNPYCDLVAYARGRAAAAGPRPARARVRASPVASVVRGSFVVNFSSFAGRGRCVHCSTLQGRSLELAVCVQGLLLSARHSVSRGVVPPAPHYYSLCGAQKGEPPARNLYIFSPPGGCACGVLRRLRLRCVFAPAGCVEPPARPARGHGCSNHSTSRTHRHPPMLSLIPLITPICQSGHRSPR